MSESIVKPATATPDTAQREDAVVQDALAKTNGNYSEEEIRKYVNMSKLLAREPIFRLIRKMLKAKSDTEYDDLIARMGRICEEKAGAHAPLAIPKEMRKDIGIHKLHIWLATGPKTHKPETAAPTQEFAETIYKQYNFLKNIAVAYWKQFQRDHADIMAELTAIFGEPVQELKIPEDNITTLCFDPRFNERIVLMAAFVDKNGKFFVRK